MKLYSGAFVLCVQLCLFCVCAALFVLCVCAASFVLCVCSFVCSVCVQLRLFCVCSFVCSVCVQLRLFCVCAASFSRDCLLFVCTLRKSVREFWLAAPNGPCLIYGFHSFSLVIIIIDQVSV